MAPPEPQSHPGSQTAATVAPDTPTSIASAATAQLAATATAKASALAPPSPKPGPASFRDSVSPKSTRSVLSPVHSPFALTGAAAQTELRQIRQKRTRDEEGIARQMSPNPGVAAVQSLLGNQISSPKDAPAATTKMSGPMAKVATSIRIPENGVSDPTQTSPISMSSLGSLDSTTAPTATAMEVTSGPLVATEANMTDDASRTPQQLESKATTSDIDGPRAFTFPPPRDQDPRHTPARGMTMPNPHAHVHLGTPSTRSPSMSGSGSSSKRHKCPYCNTDFTRHHNLKSHLLTHSQEKPYECKECNSRFRRLHDLKRHTKLHTGERPHTCPKCGRKFARGDALARHNKGAGGCAGRRSSFGAPGMGEDGQEGDRMDGLEYSQQETEEPGDMDEDMGEPSDRRRSEPSREMQRQRSNIASTYPPIQGAPSGGVSREAARGSMYPPPSGAASASSSYRDPSGPQPSQPSASSRGPGSISFPDAARQVFAAQAGITESPKPLSPGQEGHRSSISSSTFGSFPRPQHPPNTNAPTLPSLPGLSSHGPSGLHQSTLGTASNPGSHSSHERSSGGSMREILGGGGQQPADFFAMIRDLESSVARTKEEYENQVRLLQQEISMLREHMRQNNWPAPPPLQPQPR